MLAGTQLFFAHYRTAPAGNPDERCALSAEGGARLGCRARATWLVCQFITRHCVALEKIVQREAFVLAGCNKPPFRGRFSKTQPPLVCHPGGSGATLPRDRPDGRGGITMTTSPSSRTTGARPGLRHGACTRARTAARARTHNELVFHFCSNDCAAFSHQPGALRRASGASAMASSPAGYPTRLALPSMADLQRAGAPALERDLS